MNVTKTQKIKKRNKFLNVLVIFLTTLVFVRVFFNFALTMTGGWDDINWISLFLMPGLAVLALFLALYNTMKCKGHGGYVLASVVVLALATGLLAYVTLTVAFRGIA